MYYTKLQIERNIVTGKLKYTETEIPEDRKEVKSKTIMTFPGVYAIYSPIDKIVEYKKYLLTRFLTDAEANLEQAHIDYENVLALKLQIFNEIENQQM